MNKSLYFLLVVSIILISFLVSKTHLLTTNTLQNNGNWNSSKTELDMGVMGAWNFFSQTQPLNKERLNLGAWHGFQEIISNDSYTYTEINTDFMLESDAYLIIHYNILEGKKESVRLSSNTESNACLEIANSGEFIKRTPLNKLDIAENELIKLNAQLHEDEIIFTIDDRSFGCPISINAETKIGFRNGLKNVFIDNIEIINGSESVFVERFSNSKDLSSLTFLIFIIILVIEILLILIIKNKSTNNVQTIFVIFTINISVLLSLAVIYYYLINHFIGNYPNIESIISNLNKKEEIWIDNEVERISSETTQQFQNNDNQKIMFIGSSQTWGAGASTENTSFPMVFEAQLNDLLKDPQEASVAAEKLGIELEKIVVINTGISGTTSTELLNEYKINWLNLNPSAVFINLSSNDFTYGVPEKVFRKNIEDFIVTNNENNIKTFLLVEAHSPEYEVSNEYHSVLNEISENYSIEILNINSLLTEKNNLGIIWWDFIHLTDFGHHLVAEELIDFILTSKTTNLDTKLISE